MKTKTAFKKWDAAEYIETKDDVLATLDVAFRDGDIEYLLKDLGDIARSKGMAQLARELGVTREGLYRSITPTGNPSFETVLKLITLLGFRLRVEKAV